jgi:hypothetical protein
MRRRVPTVTLLALSLVILSAPSKAPTAKVAAPVYCVDGTAKPCWQMPHDVQEGFGYGSSPMNPVTQDDFDNFSWQSFVALNWAANADGTPNPKIPLGTGGVTKVWDYYKDIDEVFLKDGAKPDLNYPSKTYPPPPPACVANGVLQKGERVVRMAAKINDVTNVVSGFDEAVVDTPLVDSNGNFVMFDVMMNKDEFEYIAVKNAYYNSNNQKGAVISFPPGVKGGAEGSIELKTSWKVLSAKDDATTYITRMMRIYVPAAHSSTGKDFCTGTLNMGLIGMHILHKGMHQPDWIWSTFEHVNNAPLSSTPQPATANPPTGPCNAPASAPLMSLYNPACTTCPINTPPVQPDAPWYFATSQPYAKQYLINGKYGTQVVRCSSVWNAPNATAYLNGQWQKQLPKPYSSYMLVGSQWQALTTLTKKPAHVEATAPNKGVANGGQMLHGGRTSSGVIPAPPYLQNTTAETYLQNAAPLSATYGVGSCLGCHTGSQGAYCEDADFSFMLSAAQPVQQCTEAKRARLKKVLATMHK